MRPSMLGVKTHNGPASVKDIRPVCSADGCSRREPCGFACRDNGNFDIKKENKKLTFDNWIFNIPEDTWRRWCNEGFAAVAAEAWKTAQEQCK